ncbi:leucine-rich repeat-containing protein 40-like isoform X2 [Zootermopsis nevadensis]|uniref:leucine-rich repeat-containing protein 40-like isoform X2 n=1 Tax=Zootermopsis nevadensis TaxID=136037 RepID=UPI000B8E590C|nr:leucine-rich repeat-containing protein 40-like isoform X2 [Zootermopsis nevadensis]
MSNFEKCRYRRPPNSHLRRVNPLFHIQNQEADSKELSSHIIKLAWKTGRLNLSDRGLASVPEKVWQIDQLDEAEVRLLEVRMDRDVDGDKWWEHEPLTWLDLSLNCITEISPKIRNLVTLTVLNLHKNNLDGVPAELGCLTKLTCLNLSHNKLRTLPPAFFKLCELRSLQLAHNQLEDVTDDVGDFIMLENLDISHNCLSTLPPGIGFLTRLTQLDASHNKLAEIPPDIVSLRVLCKLDLSDNQINLLPPLGDLRKLEVLFLQHNRLVNLPDVTGCLALKELHLAGNTIKEIDVEVFEGLSRLRVLNLRDNTLTSLPEEISAFQLLARLDLTNNHLTMLPDSLGFLPHLQSVQLEGNPLRSVRRDIIQCGTTRLLRFLRERFKDEGNVNTGSDSLISAKEEAVEAEVTSVDISKNKLKEVPVGLKRLTSRITELNLSCNALSVLPFELGLSENLLYLDLQKNSLEDLPQSFESLSRLRELVISFNKFSEIPDCVYKLTSLENLIACDNRLTAIDVSGLSQLRRLATLHLANNDISHVPPELGNMTQLKCLELTGNSFRQPRHAILTKGTPGVLSYLRDRIPHNQH